MGGRVRACHEGPLLRDCDPDHPRSQARRHSSGLDADPPRQRRTRCLAGSEATRKGLSAPENIKSPRVSTNPNTRATRKKSTSTKERDWEGLLANAGIKEYGGLPVVLLVPASSWVGRPPVLGMVPASLWLGHLRNVPVRLFSRVGILRCRVAHSTVVCVATATRQNDNKRHVSSGFTKQPLGPTTSQGKNKKTNIFHCFRRQHGTGKLRTTLPHIKLVFELRTHVCGQRCRTP